MILPFPGDPLPAQPPPAPTAARVNSAKRNERYHRAWACLDHLWAMYTVPSKSIGVLKARVDWVHQRWSGWQVKAREGLVVAAEWSGELDHEEYAEIAEGLEEDFVHPPPWFETLDQLADEVSTLARLDDGDPSVERRAEVDDIRAHLDECLTRLLSPAGVT